MKIVFSVFFFILLVACSPSTKTGKADSVPDSTMQLQVKADAFSEDPGTDDHVEADLLMRTETVGQLQLGLSDKSTIKSTGIPDYKSAITRWEADGMYHQDWTYDSGIDLNMASSDSLKMEIFSLRFFAPCKLKTSRTIGIGSSMEDVKAAYKDVLSENHHEEQSLIAGSVYGGIIFSFENGKLSSVFIGAAAE